MALGPTVSTEELQMYFSCLLHDLLKHLCASVSSWFVEFSRSLIISAAFMGAGGCGIVMKGHRANTGVHWRVSNSVWTTVELRGT